jgi:hypothetical protein
MAAQLRPLRQSKKPTLASHRLKRRNQGGFELVHDKPVTMAALLLGP